ncbi:MAG: hypothetical protein WCZ65_13200 [Lysobacteraceae bacterium]
MELFLHIATGFPTIVFSILLGVAMVYWLLAMTGLVDLDALDFAELPDAEGMELGGLSGLLMKFGLDGVPLALILTVLGLLAWLICYFADFFLLRHLPFDLLRYGLGALLIVLAVVIATPFTGLALRPLRGLFAKVRAVDSVSLLGRSAVVRSPLVSAQQGTADLDDGGAGLVLQVRSEDAAFKRGDKVVLVEYLDAQNAYRVIAG